MLPTPYQKEAQPFRHFDDPEELARDRVREELESGHAEFRHESYYRGWYGHGTMIHYDKLIVMQCGGEEMRVVFDYQRLLREAQMPRLL